MCSLRKAKHQGVYINKLKRLTPQYRLPCGPITHPITYMYTRNKRDELVKFALHTGTLRTVTDVLNMADVEIENLYRARYHKRL